MQRRTVIAGMGTLLLAGCTTTTDNGSDATETTPEPSEVPDTDFTFTFDGAESVKIAHVGNDNIDDETTTKLAVTVDGEQVPVTYKGTESTYVVADDDQLGDEESAVYDYPLSIGNTVTVPASPGATVEIVWYPQHGETQAIAEHTVPESTATTEAAGTTEATGTTDATETTEATETAGTTGTTDA